MQRTCWFVVLAVVVAASAEYLQEIEVAEGLPAGSTIGSIEHGKPPYLVIPVPGSAVDQDLAVDHSTGMIQTRTVLDREMRPRYAFVAIPPTGENVRVVIRVKDENDNAPEFPQKFLAIEFPENTPRDMKRTLTPAKDRDLGLFNTQRYEILSGNVNNAFRLSSHRERDEILYLDLQINGFLDRETTPFYSLVIEALDGGSPPLRGHMTVNITIQDVNDNPPIFNQSRYFATVAENATVGTSALRVFATDADAGENGRVTYAINRRQSDRDSMFAIDPQSGVVSVAQPLDFESKAVHELVVVAKDAGVQPLETTAFVSVRVTDVNDNQPTINLIFLSDDATPKISEAARPGEFVARISVNDPDSREEYNNVNVSLDGGDGHFGLATQDNIIYLVIVSHPLDREKTSRYRMSVTATDRGSPPLHASRGFELRVTDANDNAPRFARAVFHATVAEVADPGSSVLHLRATDPDEGENARISYSLAGDSPWFGVDERTGLVTTRAALDCETEPVPRLTVVATDHGEPPLSASATLLVTISDVNDNEPVFDQSFYNVTVSESVAVETCILKVSATDPDCGVNAEVNYTAADRSGDFTVRPGTGELCVARPLDREARSQYEIPILATDRGGLSTTAMVRVQVTDANDNRPVFYPRQYNVSLQAGSAPAAALVVVRASDPDSGDFGRVTYAIVSGNRHGFFRIKPQSGEVFLTKPLGATAPTYHLTVSAADGGGQQAEMEAEVFVSVTGPQQQPPVFHQPRYSFGIREDAPLKTLLGQVAVSPRASRPGPVRYSISSGDPESLFTIEPSSGAIMTRGTLDHERRSTMLLNIQAMSGHPPAYGHTQVNVTIWDVNDNAPHFESPHLKLSVPESAPLHTAISMVHATDADSGSNSEVHYRLLDNPGGTFQIHRQTGSLSLLRPLDYETRRLYVLTIQAADSGTPVLYSNVTLTIEVQDFNDHPPVFDSASYQASVSETMPANTQILQVTATDLDTGNNARLTYRISDHMDKFGIFPNSGFLYLKQHLDREEQDSFTIGLSAIDNGSPPRSANTTVEVKVLDANDNDPRFSQKEYQFSLEENREKGHPVGMVFASDMDLGNNASVRYSLLNNSSSFHINPITGEIVSKRPLDRERVASYRLEVEARDQGRPPRADRSLVLVSVLDTNDNPPVFIEPQDRVIELKEEQPVGTVFMTVLAKDPDEADNGDIIYDIVKSPEDSDGSGQFSVHPQLGQIRTAAVLDHEAQESYSLTVRARDKGTPSLQALLHLKIRLSDVNDNQPMFPASALQISVEEGIPVGFEVGTVQAVDRDGGDSVLYTLISGGNGIFDVSRTTGSVFTIGEVDFEWQPSYQLQVKAADSVHSSVITVTINVQDVNDCAPHFEDDPILFSVSEMTMPGSVVWNFTARDGDSGPNGHVRYAVAQRPDNFPFSLDPESGTLSLTNSLDYETTPEYTIVVSATDQPVNRANALSTSATCRILVEDENDNAPVFFSTDHVEIAESEPPGSPVIQLAALDKDSRDNGRIQFSIASGNQHGYFELNPSTGLLTLLKPLDREAAAHFELNITATDHGRTQRSAHQALTIDVQDINDNPPRFLQPVYRANISEDAPVGSLVTQVQASDPDLGEHSNLTFSLPAGSATFSIDSVTGKIHTTGKLDRETTAEHFLTVQVQDGTLLDSTTVRVAVTDVNDHAPAFQDSCYPLVVPENSEMGLVHTFLAVDPDAGANAKILYSLAGGNLDNKFHLDPHTGQLSCQPLDREQVSRYEVLVVARDHGTPPRSASCSLSVTVADHNDNDPAFDQPEYTAAIPENTAPNTTVLTVRAHDPDDGINARISYSLSNETLFWIDSATGAIKTAGLFDREKREVHTFEVRATDGGRYDARSEKVFVHVTIVDVNDNRPQFSQFPFSATVSPHAAPGTQVAQLRATDLDLGVNGEVVYSFAPGAGLDGRFHLASDTGVVTVASSLLAEAGRRFHAEVVARDRGSPPQAATGVLEISVEGQARGPALQFTNNSYRAELPENCPRGTEVLAVRAVGPSGLAVTYSLADGSAAFDIQPRTGRVTVRDPRQLDYEQSPLLSALVVAHCQGPTGSLYGYATLTVRLTDVNDNPPSFSQDRYVSSVWEGNNKGTFVTQVVATDEDMDGAGLVVYHIVDGNHDDAFSMEPPFSGIVKTNIVLDREIRDSYVLTIAASDEGQPALSATCTLRISIIDVNDNLPVFPPHSSVTVSEGAEVGSVVATITANDVDAGPELEYSLAPGSGPHFTIDRFSGRVNLAAPLDRETAAVHRLAIRVSDRAHLAETTLTVEVADLNDNPPVFSQASYQVDLPETLPAGHLVTTINAADRDSGDNAKLSYALEMSSLPGFYVEESTGRVVANSSVSLHGLQPQLVVSVRDHGAPPLSALAVVRLVGPRAAPPVRPRHTLRLHEDTAPGTPLLPLPHTATAIVAGNINGTFGLTPGRLVLLKPLDRKASPLYSLQIGTSDNVSLEVEVHVEAANNLPLQFNQSRYQVSVSEAAAVGTPVLTVAAVGRASYNITSGNNDGCFAIDASTGAISVARTLDYEVSPEHRFVVRATDQGPASALAIVTVVLLDENDHSPQFPLPVYQEFVEENAPAGTVVFTAQATDGDKGRFGQLSYSISGVDSSNFHIGSATGKLTTTRPLDLETRARHMFTVTATDQGGRAASATVQVDVNGHDEFPPQFERNAYHFSAPADAPAGFVLGMVRATDRDEGADGKVVYTLRASLPGLRLNSTTGELVTTGQQRPGGPVVAHVIASSGRPGSRTGRTVVHVDGSAAALQGAVAPGGIPGWAMALLALFTLGLAGLGVFLLLRHRRRTATKPALHSAYDLGMHAPPPHYNDIAQFSTREDQSQSSGRGSAEDDEEIRMITEGRGAPEVEEEEEVRTTEEYLARLGISTDRPDYGEVYSRLGSVTGSLSSMVPSEDELRGSYNWDYLLDWGPQYQPLAHVFAEIARLKDDGPPAGAHTKPPLAPRPGAGLHTSQLSFPSLPRSPASSPAMSPSFSPALSPLAHPC